MRRHSSALVMLFLASALPAAHAQTVTSSARERASDLRERAVANCNANRGTDCLTKEGLKEWIDAERPRPPGQRSAIMEQKLVAQRRAQQQAAPEATTR